MHSQRLVGSGKASSTPPGARRRAGKASRGGVHEVSGSPHRYHASFACFDDFYLRLATAPAQSRLAPALKAGASPVASGRRHHRVEKPHPPLEPRLITFYLPSSTLLQCRRCLRVHCVSVHACGGCHFRWLAPPVWPPQGAQISAVSV